MWGRGHEEARILCCPMVLNLPSMRLYTFTSEKPLLSIKDIRTNGSHFKTIKEKEVKYLCITSKCSTRSIHSSDLNHMLEAN